MFLKAKKPYPKQVLTIVCFKNDQGDLGKIHLQNDSASVFPLVQAFQDVLALLTVGSVGSLSRVSEKKSTALQNWRLTM